MTTDPDTATERRPSRDHNREPWTGQRILALGAVTDLPTAAAIFGLSRTSAYDLARRGLFPVPVLRAGTRYRVPVAPILAALHLVADPHAAEADLTPPVTGAWITDMKSEASTPPTWAGPPPGRP